MPTIQANASGSKSIEVSDQHLATLRRYALLDNLADSNGIVDEDTLDKLRLHARSLLESADEKDNALLDLCLDVLYNDKMKAYGLRNLMALYAETAPAEETGDEPA